MFAPFVSRATTRASGSWTRLKNTSVSFSRSSSLLWLTVVFNVELYARRHCGCFVSCLWSRWRRPRWVICDWSNAVVKFFYGLQVILVSSVKTNKLFICSCQQVPISPPLLIRLCCYWCWLMMLGFCGIIFVPQYLRLLCALLMLVYVEYNSLTALSYTLLHP